MTTKRCFADTLTFGEKTREWDARDYEIGADVLRRDEATGRAVTGKGCVAQVREMWEALANEALVHAGSSARIDRRSLADQGLEREPVNRSRASLELQKRGILTEQAREMIRRESRNEQRAKSNRAKDATRKPLPAQSIEDYDNEGMDNKPSPSAESRETDRETIRAEYRARVRQRDTGPNPTATEQTQKREANKKGGRRGRAI